MVFALAGASFPLSCGAGQDGDGGWHPSVTALSRLAVTFSPHCHSSCGPLPHRHPFYGAWSPFSSHHHPFPQGPLPPTVVLPVAPLGRRPGHLPLPRDTPATILFCGRGSPPVARGNRSRAPGPRSSLSGGGPPLPDTPLPRGRPRLAVRVTCPSPAPRPERWGVRASLAAAGEGGRCARPLLSLSGPSAPGRCSLLEAPSQVFLRPGFKKGHACAEGFQVGRVLKAGLGEASGVDSPRPAGLE